MQHAMEGGGFKRQKRSQKAESQSRCVCTRRHLESTCKQIHVCAVLVVHRKCVCTINNINTPTGSVGTVFLPPPQTLIDWSLHKIL